jgi:hypothetical protein
MATKFMYSDQVANKLPGSNTNYVFRTRTSYEVDGNGKPTGAATTVVYYAPKPGARTSDGKTWTNGTADSIDNFDRGGWVPAATTGDGGKTYRYTEYDQSDVDRGIVSADKIGTPVLGATAQQSLSTSGGIFSQTIQNTLINTAANTQPGLAQVVSAKQKNAATTPIGTDPSSPAVKPEDKEAFEEALKDLKGNSRKKYDLNLRYPEKLQLEYQDCIKFSALEYKPPGLNASSGGSNENRSVTLDSFKRPTIGKDGKREILGSVTLPIPGGISDGNSVDWQDDKLDPFGKAFASIAVEGITNGGEGAFKELSSQFKGARTSGLLAMVPSKFAEAVTGTSNLLQRTTGAAPNPNLELLFTGPSLRSFTFNFRLSPRSKEEAIEVRRIIRFFKQTMSVKRSTSTLLLGSPHTFAIAYLTSNKEHPYLNKFKECALQSCNVSYTPDGNYMSFNGPEPSMTSYEMSLTFKELEPIFDDDYKTLDSNADTQIGY